MKLWHGLCSLDNDPHPVVGAMSYKVTNHVRNKVMSEIPLRKFGYNSVLTLIDGTVNFILGEGILGAKRGNRNENLLLVVSPAISVESN